MLGHISFDEASIAACVRIISRARLGSYRRFFGARTDLETLGLYQWNDEVSGRLFRLLSWIEIALRNQFHHAMSQRYGTQGTQGSSDWYRHVRLDGRSQANIDAATVVRHGRGTEPVSKRSPDDVVSSLTFGFWPHLLNVELDAHHQALDWGSILVDVLPGHRQRQPSFWVRRKHRDALFGRLDLCNALRNRIAHHEPVWKLGPLYREGRPRRGRPLELDAPAPSVPGEALARLRDLHDRAIELLGWLAPVVARGYLGGKGHRQCLELLSVDGLEAYRRFREAPRKE